jgi:hypothetical protein
VSLSFEPNKTVDGYGQKGYFDTFSILLGAVVENVRKIFEQRNDATIYIPVFD